MTLDLLMTEIPTLERPRNEDYVFLAVVCVCIFSTIPVAIAVFLLQRQLAPGDSFLFEPTPIGELMLLVPTLLLSMVPAVALSKYIADRIRHWLKMAPADPLLAPALAASARSTNWKLVGTILAALLVAIGGKGFGSYFYLTERGLSVRPPLEFSLRHYQWEDVAAVSMRCRPSRKGPGFRYVLRMSDGVDIDFGRGLTPRFASAFERITSRLDSLSGVRYEFDISEKALAALGKKHGTGLANAIRSQVLRHGGVVQR
jgi:hypothetical protein